MPIDDGHLILSDEQRSTLLSHCPDAYHWIRRYLGGEEFMNGIARWCLWLTGIEPAELRAMPPVLEHVERVRQFRAGSRRTATRELAKQPALFGEIRQPDTPYLLIPKVSSETRLYLPIGFCPVDWVASGSSLIIPEATLGHLGILSSAMHMAWMRYVCGRMKSDYQYSAQIVYNNFPWPGITAPVGTDEAATARAAQLRAAIEQAAQAVLNARAAHPAATLAQLYDPLTMPAALLRAHQALDRAVDAAYRPDGGARSYAGDAQRVAFLFTRYAALSAPLA
jgi:hypothetical protein